MKTMEPIPIPRGARVVVAEPGIEPWSGLATAVKWSHVSGWWVDVRRDADGITWQLKAHLVRVVEEAS